MVASTARPASSSTENIPALNFSTTLPITSIASSFGKCSYSFPVRSGLLPESTNHLPTAAHLVLLRLATTQESKGWRVAIATLSDLELPTYQRLFCRPPPPLLPRYPPPPDPRSAFGRASLTVSALPSRSVPFKAAIALSPSELESNTSGLSGIPVGDDVDAINIAMYCERGSNRLFGSAEAEISYKNILHF
jgi:hypothetical protein